MNAFQLTEIAKVLDARLFGDDLQVDAVFTDSRLSCNGLFVAIKGEHHDAHDYLSQAFANGAKAALVETKSAIERPQLVVDNTRLALGRLGQFNRRQNPCQLVAITGSSGKTTVKEMLAAILAEVGKTYATPGNLNNDIGAPLSLLSIDQSYEFAVIELGANHPGEIAYTASLAEPQVALVNNVAAAHIEGFGSLQGVAEAKAEIYQALAATGVAVINRDDPFAALFIEKNQHLSQLSFSLSQQADVRAENVEVNRLKQPRFDLLFDGKRVSVELPLIGRHNVSNALAAASCALALGVSLSAVAAGLSKVASVCGRLVGQKLANGCLLINDSYNANVGSTRAAIDLLASYSGKRVLVLGDMAELGADAASYHFEIGDYARQAGIDLLLTRGIFTLHTQKAFAGPGEHFESHQALAEALLAITDAGTTVLVKGSRSSAMEKVIERINDNNEVVVNTTQREAN